MNEIIMMIVVLLPMLTGVLIPLLPFKKRTWMMVYIEAAAILTSILVIYMLLHRPEESLVLFRFTGNLSVSFRLDGLGSVFAGRVSVLWPVAVLYSFE